MASRLWRFAKPKKNRSKPRNLPLFEVQVQSPAFPMKPLKFLASDRFCLIQLLSLMPALSALAQPDPNWLIHDRLRPQPPVVTPGMPSTQERVGTAPSDAVVLFDGQNLTNWVSLDGSPTKWIMRDG